MYQNCTITRKSKTLFNKNLPDGELNPGLPRDRRGYLPLYYRGYVRAWTIFVANNQLLFTPRHSTIYIISCFMCDINELYTMMWLFYMMYDIRTVEYWKMVMNLGTSELGKCGTYFLTWLGFRNSILVSKNCLQKFFCTFINLRFVYLNSSTINVSNIIYLHT